MAFNTTTDKAQKISIDLSKLVSGQREALQRVQKREQSRKEAQFQRVVMEEGLSYDDQLDYRKEQLKEEKNSVTPDTNYINELNKEIGNLRKLRRFKRIRDEYMDSYDELVSGERSLKDHKEFLEETLATVSDPDKQQELRENIAQTRQKIMQEEQKTLKNRVALAKKDGTIGVIEGTIKDLKKRKAFAESNGNTAAASNWEVSITSLQKQMNETQIENQMHDMQFDLKEGSMGAGEKLNALDNKIDESSTSAPVTVNGTDYDSARDFWRSARDNYLAGRGQIPGFENFFGEINQQVKNKVDRLSEINKFGFVPLNALDSISRDYKNLANREYMAPFADKLESAQVSALSYGTQKSAEAIRQSAVQSLQAQSGVKALDRLQSRYGIDMTSEKFALQEEVLNKGGSLEARGEAMSVLERVGAEVPSGEIEEGTDPTSLVEDTDGVGTESTVESTEADESSFDVSGSVGSEEEGEEEEGTSAQIPSVDDTEETTTQDTTVQSTTEQTPAQDTNVTDRQSSQTVQQNEEDPSPESASNYREVEIRSGDTLSGIAQRELGDPTRYQEIADFNEIEDPDKIKSGNTIRIPVSMGK